MWPETSETQDAEQNLRTIPALNHPAKFYTEQNGNPRSLKSYVLQGFRQDSKYSRSLSADKALDESVRRIANFIPDITEMVLGIDIKNPS